MSSESDLDVVRRGLELFNKHDLEQLFEEIFHPDVDWRGDEGISVLTGLPVDTTGRAGVRNAWTAFFAMFDEINLEDVEFSPGESAGEVRGSARMVTRGGASEVPVQVVFNFAWVVEEERWRFLAAKRSPGEAVEALHIWLAGRNAGSN